MSTPSEEPATADTPTNAPALETSPAVEPAPSLPVAPPVLQTHALTRRYGRLTALDHLDLTLERHDLFGFIGPNGAGKTTTMKIVTGLLNPTSGAAMVMGRSVVGHGDFVRRNVGYMPDNFGVYEDLRVDEYLHFFASAYGIPRRERRKVVGDVLELTDLVVKRTSLVDSLSKGMQQRLGLARVLVHDPPLLLLDEPAAGLDPRARIELRELLKELQRLGKTILVSSHILSELGEFCNKLGIIERGKLIVAGTREELVEKARIGRLVELEPYLPGGMTQDTMAKAQIALERDPRVVDVQQYQGHLRVNLAEDAPHHSFLVELLSAAGIHVHRLAPHEMKLEDVFLRLTQGIVQ